MENKTYSGQMVVEFLITLFAVTCFLYFWQDHCSPKQMEEFIEVHEIKNLSL